MSRGFEDRIPEPIASPAPLDVPYGAFDRGPALGRGGNADVHRATVDHEGGPLTVAIKQPRFQGTVSTAVVERFVDEAETWARLDDDPGIVGVLDWGTEPLPWLALEYMDGGSLAERVGGLDAPEATWIGVRLARAVRYAHRHGVAHLDLKPANVLFRETPGDRWDFPKVSDWGLARLMLDHSTSVEGLSPTYAAPEQFDEEAYGSPDDFTDIYQLGAVVYELVTGEPPFTGSATAVMRDVLDTEPVPPSERAPGLPAAFDDVLGRALAKEKADRYESMLDLRRALEGLLDDLATDAGTGTAAAAGAGAGADGAGTTAVGPESRDPDRGATDDSGAADSSAATDPSAATDDSAGGLPRRRLLQGGALAALATAGGAAFLGTRDGGDAARNELGGGATPTDRAAASGTAGTGSGVEYDGWFDRTSNFEGTVDATGESEIRVAVGATGADGPLAFAPAAVRVDPETTIVWDWTGNGGSHGVRAESGAYEFPAVDGGGNRFAVRFRGRGVSKYYCPPHESLGMRGAVVVGDADGTEGAQPTAEPVDRSTPTATPTNRELRQGVLLPISGSLGDLGQSMAEAAVLPARQLEESDLPVTVETQVVDTETDPNTAVDGAGALAESGFPAVTGPGASQSALDAAREVFTPAGVVGCTPSATGAGISALADDGYVWRTVASDTLQGRALARLADGTASVGLIVTDSGYGVQVAEAFGAAYGGSIQASRQVPAGADSYTEALADVLSGEPEGLLFVGYPESGIQLLADYYDAYSPARPIFVPGGMRTGSVPESVNQDLLNVRGTSLLSEGPGYAAFAEAYQSAHGRAPTTFTAESYDATAVCLLANAAAGANDGAAIRDAISLVTNGNGTTVGPGNLREGVATLLDGGEVVYEGAASPVVFDENGDLARATYAVFRYTENGTERTDTVRVD